MTPIAQCEEQLRRAMLAGDIAALDALIDDDLSVVGPSGQVFTKAMDLDARGGAIRRFRAGSISTPS